MFFSSSSNKKGKSHYVVREYRDVTEPDGSVKRKRVQTKVRFVQPGPERSEPPSSESEDEHEDIDNFQFEPFDYDTAEPSLSSSGTEHQKRKQSSVRHWQNIRPRLIRASLTTEGFPSQEDAVCRRCKGGQSAKYRCIDCGSAALSMCKSCCDSLHSSENVFHCPEVWLVRHNSFCDMSFSCALV